MDDLPISNFELNQKLDGFFNENTLKKGETLILIRHSAGNFEVCKEDGISSDLLKDGVSSKISNVVLKEFQENLKTKETTTQNQADQLNTIRANVKESRKNLGVQKRVQVAVKHLFAKEKDRTLLSLAQRLDIQGRIKQANEFSTFSEDTKVIKKLSKLMAKVRNNNTQIYDKYCSKNGPLQGGYENWEHYLETKEEVKFLLEFINIALESTAFQEKPNIQNDSQTHSSRAEKLREKLEFLKSELSSLKYHSNANNATYGDTSDIGIFVTSDKKAFSENLNSLCRLIHMIKSE